MRTPINWTACRPWLQAAALITLVGCGSEDQVRRYQVPHEAPSASNQLDRPNPAVAQQRALAAIVPHDGQAWFFKALNAADLIQPIVADFDRLLESVTFVDNKPRWKLPDSWTQSAGNEFRFATLNVGAVEVAVSSFALPAGGDFDQYLVANVNRWRGQVGMPEVDAGQLATVTRTLKLSEGMAVVFDSGAPSDQPPVARDGGPESLRDANSDGRVSSNGLTYDVPKGWETGARKPMRLATFVVKGGGKQLEITLSRLDVNSGSMLSNVNRWRGQIGLGDIDQAELEKEAQTIEIDGSPCQYVQLDNSEGTQQAIYVVVVKRPDHTLFVKMMGDRALALAEKEAFRRFAESIRFNS